ncbi:Peptide methionine sulfoxide reductase MsrB [Paraburkholderia ultramafica]|uniref:peptide-methionine (R)-S-oxide reductase n=1 Tax=Paraburkholderia ultramafica TaxID=1544867 RepID=A0A6S7BDI8_9BURK|nr:Peptide methionine sulfoxide reductase MsrB [Paraburkholderia ultramafica]
MACSRRIFLRLIGAASLAGGAPTWRTAHAADTGAAAAYEVSHSDAEWHKLLSDAQYNVLREAGTERPFSSPLNDEQRAGTFACAGCKLPLFSSKTKFDSGTGWPSFWQPLDHAVITHTDKSFGMTRDEVLCRRCGGPPRSRVRRRTQTDRPALLHERSRIDIHARGGRRELSESGGHHEYRETH